MLVQTVHKSESFAMTGPGTFLVVMEGRKAKVIFDAPESTRIQRLPKGEWEERQVERIRQEHMEEAASE